MKAPQMAERQPDAIDQDIADLELLRSNVVAAGIIATGFFRSPMKTWTKENASPVSEADHSVNDFLQKSLCSARPDYGWLSEESVDGPSRMDAERCFVIDPIDGTRAFIRGDDCWCVCAAIVEDGRPVVGVIYAPARNELFYAHAGGGAYLNDQVLAGPDGARTAPLISGPVAVHNALTEVAVVFESAPNFPSLALRLVEVATGGLDASVARRGAQDWDIAAADLILAESNVGFEDVCGGVPLYNKAETRHGALAAIGPASLKMQMHDILRKIYGCPDSGTETDKTEQTKT